MDELLLTLIAARDAMAAERDPKQVILRRYMPEIALAHRMQWDNVRGQMDSLIARCCPRPADVPAPRESAAIPQADGC